MQRERRIVPALPRLSPDSGNPHTLPQMCGDPRIPAAKTPSKTDHFCGPASDVTVIVRGARGMCSMGRSCAVTLTVTT